MLGSSGDDLREALVATGLFNSIGVEPVRTGQPGPDGTEQVDLLVRQSKGPFRSLSGSAGYGTGEGAKVEGSWTHRNLFPPCLLYTSPSPRDGLLSRMPSSA